MKAARSASEQRHRLARFRWTVRGQVQGVGFRPFVYRIAQRCGLSGWVCNDSTGASIEAQGAPHDLRRFDAALHTELPPLAAIRAIELHRVRTLGGEEDFRIAGSRDDTDSDADISIDTAVCDDCLREMRDPRDRRHAYPLINCTQCGPRFSIVTRTPYDRPNTTMRDFEMCPDCRREYEDPTDRRFHAQPTACHRCGPAVELVDPRGRRIEGDPIDQARRRLLAGQIVAVKGLGAFHLAVRADSQSAVLRLRELKHRPTKPLAVMFPSVASAARCAELGTRGAAMLTSPAAPIVLCPRIDHAAVCAAVAPASHRLGVMLPYTPLHHLLFADPAMPPLVMTSANDSGQPLVIENSEALARLGGMCDALLWHNRPIQRGVDDSVLIHMADAAPIPLRRARGFVPTPIALPIERCTDGIAVGGELKAAVAVVRNGQAILSQHLGDLSDPDSFALFRRTIDEFIRLFSIRPKWIAHDMHPAYLGAQHAIRLADQLHIPAIAVQHHHAHAAAVMVEHRIDPPALAVVCDGTGYGTDGSIWGGELLQVDYRGFRRLGHLKPLRLPGGDASARDPRRSALALLWNAMGTHFRRWPRLGELFPDTDEREVLAEMIQTDRGCALSSGAGRVFDGVAALLGICTRNTFEAEAAMALEAAASRAPALDGPDAKFQMRWKHGALELDYSELIRHLVGRLERGDSPNRLAALFHEHFARSWAALVVRLQPSLNINRVVLSGGVFCNELLTRRLTQLLVEQGCEVWRHEQVPPNDGGIALGQAAVAATLFTNGKAGT